MQNNNYEAELLSIVKKLISYKSITPQDAGIMEYIMNFLQELNFTCYLKYFGEGDKRTSNLYAVFSYHLKEHNIDDVNNDNLSKSFNLCFVGHVDVVDPINISLWKNKDPFNLHIENDILYGRGIVDMKGSIACFLLAVKKYIHDIKTNINNNINSRKQISILLTSDEEGDATYGTQKMLEYIYNNNLPKIDFCIVGEPTSKKYIGDIVKIGRRGSINFKFTITGKAGHVAYPEQANNPISKMTSIVNDLNNVTFDSGNQYFQPSNLEITSIDVGNNSSNVIPNDISILFNVRFNILHNASDIINKIEKIIENIFIKKQDIDQIKDHQIHYHDNESKDQSKYQAILKYKITAHPFMQEVSDNIKNHVNIIEKIIKNKVHLKTDGGTSDARFLCHYTPLIEIGLKNDSAHKINEYCTNSDLQTLFNVYYGLLAKSYI